MKTLLLDDHALLRETLAAVMAQTWPALQVLQAGNLTEACALSDPHPDQALVLVDLGLPDALGLASLTTLMAHAPDARHVGCRPTTGRKRCWRPSMPARSASSRKRASSG